MADNGASNVSTTVGELHFVTVRFFNAPKELVFRTFTEAEHLARWWAPKPYTIPFCKVDFRPGGLWHYSMRSPAGEEHWVRAVYSEIDRPNKVEYTALFADEHANPLDTIPEQFVTIGFADEGAGTKLSFRVRFTRPEDLQATLKMQMVEGLTMTFGNLDELLAELNG